MSTLSYREAHREELREKQREYRKKNLDKVRKSNREYSRRTYDTRKEYMTNWRAMNEDKIKRSRRNHHLKRMYGLTIEEEHVMLEAQNGCCAVCGDSAPLVVDHCHTTGVVRGLLCGSCNRTLGQSKESPARLRALADWLDALGE